MQKYLFKLKLKKLNQKQGCRLHTIVYSGVQILEKIVF